ncbi:unnamed protein product [Hydatigera taeniaeformis]|uniref:Uncharacterized protein n=1 Tax=Hydatigena taeniaeformis TaxID=6205 RepID=A0A0R3X234_HYDTA|nr:unnamed protein product [Hydatigera taeniaeformis]
MGNLGSAVDALGNGSPLPTNVKRYKHKSEVQSYRCCRFSPSETSKPLIEGPQYAINGLQLGTGSEGRKNVRFSEQIGCVQISCIDLREGLVERISGRLKSFCNPRSSTVIFASEPSAHLPSLLCLPKCNRRRQSIGSIEVAVWNSGRQLRQTIASPTPFRRFADFPSNLLRGHEVLSFDKWRSQPSLESHVHKNKMGMELPLNSHFDRMESVYLSDLDEDYEWGSTPSEWEGYEIPLSILAQKANMKQVKPWELTSNYSSDEDYEFDEYMTPKTDLLHILKANKCTQCKVIKESPERTESSDEKLTSSAVTLRRTALQDRVANSLNRLNLPEWMKNKPKGMVEAKHIKSSVRLPRFPRHHNAIHGSRRLIVQDCSRNVNVGGIGYACGSNCIHSPLSAGNMSAKRAVTIETLSMKIRELIS